MAKRTRRDVILATTALASGSICTNAASQMTADKSPSNIIDAAVVHIVFFWLNRPDSKEDIVRLVTGLQAFKDVPGVRGIHVGVPDLTKQRGVVDSSYSASIILHFDNQASFEAHATHPIHERFFACCNHLFKKVVAYDPKPAEVL